VEGTTHRESVDALHDAYLRALARNALRAAEERARNRSRAIGRLKDMVAEDSRRKEGAR
jgi:hypothetical protein